MRLALLEAEFLRVHWSEGGQVHHATSKFSEADGIIFRCPKCYAKEGSLHGVHSVLTWFRHRANVTLDVTPGPSRWEALCHGETFETLTLAPSIRLTSGCEWHGFIRNGETLTL